MRVGVCAALLASVLGAGEPLPVLTASMPQAPAAPSPPASGSVQGSGGRLDLSATTPERRSLPVLGAPTDSHLPKGWSFQFEAPDACTVCPGRTSVGALWRSSGTLTWEVGANKFRVGLTGERGARLPLFMTAPGSGNFVPMASDVTLSDTRTHWVLTLGAEHVLLDSPDRTVSVFGDLFLPLGSKGRAPTTPGVRTPEQGALMGGVRLRSKPPVP